MLFNFNTPRYRIKGLRNWKKLNLRLVGINKAWVDSPNKHIEIKKDKFPTSKILLSHSIQT